jgi:hypothetical protein
MEGNRKQERYFNKQGDTTTGQVDLRLLNGRQTPMGHSRDGDESNEE